MNRPRVLVYIQGQYISCLGTDLLKILNVINVFCKNLVWYGADVEVNGDYPFRYNLQGSIPQKIGDINQIMRIAQNTDQFLSGVFFALSNDVGEIWDHEFSTEDPPFRDIEEAILEIRAFDTLYYEIYSNYEEIIYKLSKHFSVDVVNDENS